MFGLSERLSERLIQKVKSPILCVFLRLHCTSISVWCYDINLLGYVHACVLSEVGNCVHE